MQPRLVLTGLAPPSLTQAGIAKALGTSQGNVSNALKRLVRGGALRVRRSSVADVPQRLKVYQLTAEGDAIVAHIKEGMGLQREHA